MNAKPKLTLHQMTISEDIQSELVHVIRKYLDEKPSLIDALDWALTVICNDHARNLNVYENSHCPKKEKE